MVFAFRYEFTTCKLFRGNLVIIDSRLFDYAVSPSPSLTDPRCSRWAKLHLSDSAKVTPLSIGLISPSQDRCDLSIFLMQLMNLSSDSLLPKPPVLREVDHPPAGAPDRRRRGFPH